MRPSHLALVEAAMADLRGLSSSGSPSAAVALGSSEPGVRDMAKCRAAKNGAHKVGLSTTEAVYGVIPVGQAIAVLARGAWALSGNCGLNRNTANAIEGSSS